MSEQQADWVESIEVFGHWGAVAGWQAEAAEAWAGYVRGGGVMRDRIDRLEQAERDLERVEAQRDQLREALADLVADISGRPKSCGHHFDCICAGDKAITALDATKEDSP